MLCVIVSHDLDWANKTHTLFFYIVHIRFIIDKVSFILNGRRR